MTEDEHDDADLDRLLRTLDHAPPTITVEDVVARARRRRAPWGRIAAAVAVALGLAGVAYALPGSPVRTWVDAALARTEPAAPGRPATPRSPDPAAGGGVAFDPAQPLTVVVRHPDGAAAPSLPPGGPSHLLVTLADGGELTARVVGGDARFASEPGRLLVELQPGDTLHIRVPRSARRVVIVADGQRLFSKEGADISAPRPPVQAGRYDIPLGSPPP